MVTPVPPVPLTGAAQQPARLNADQTLRSIAEARRILFENHITGAKASRIMAMLSMAEQYVGNGRSFDAQRIAREALKQVRGIEEDIKPSASRQEEEKPIRPEDNPENEETPAEEALDSDGNSVFQRETTSYQDGSSDSGISFQSPTPFTQAQAPFAVRQHELSHVRRETSDAILEGRRVMTSVQIHSHIDPQTGERHVGGGRARVIVFPNIKTNLQNGEKLNIKA